MRILHISDFHARSSVDYEREIVLREFLTDLNEVASSKPFDFVCFSGDISQSAKPQEFDIANDALIEPIFKALGLDNSALMITPGNHDVDRDKIEEVILDGLRTAKTREKLAARMSHENFKSRYTASLDPFRSFLESVVPIEGSDLRTPLGLSTTRKVGNSRIQFSMLNTAWASDGTEDDGANRVLALGEMEVNRHAQRAADHDYAIAIFHHPFEWIADWDTADTKPIAESAFDLILTGHTHKNDPEIASNAYGIVGRSRAGALYESRRRPISYTIIDLDTADGACMLTVRERVAGTNSGFGPGPSCRGQLRPSAPKGTGQPSFADVCNRLADLARQTSVLGDTVTDLDEASIEDLLIDPVLLPVPYQHWAKSREPGDAVKDVRIEAELVRSSDRVLIVAGDRETGLTSTLIWLLHESYRRDIGRVPVLVEAARIGQGQRALHNAIADAVRLSGGTEVPGSLIVAIDNFHLISTPRQQRILEAIAENENYRFILGCATGSEDAVGNLLSTRSIDHRLAFVAPFGRDELQELSSRLAPDAAKDIVNRILRLLHGENLPRTPFLMVALIRVVSAGSTTTRLGNETAILDRYVRLLLGSANLSEDPRFSLDERDRDLIISALAGEMTRIGHEDLTEDQCVHFLAEYFKSRGWTSLSPMRVIRTFEERRIMVRRSARVGFRHEAFGHLFVAKQMDEDEKFYDFMLADPLAAAPALRHLASIRRTDLNLLNTVTDVFKEKFEHLIGLFPLDLFQAVSVKSGFSGAEDLRQLSELAVTPPSLPNGRDSDQQDGRMWERAEAQSSAQLAPGESGELEPSDDGDLSEDALMAFTDSLQLASTVLRNSQHIADLAMTTELLTIMLRGWAWVYMLVAVTEDTTGHAKVYVRQLLQEMHPGKKPDEGRLDEIVQMVIVGMTSSAVSGTLGSKKLEGQLQATLDSQEFMKDTPSALIGTLLAADMRMDGWSRRLRDLLALHGDNAVVREVLHRYARYAYFRSKLEDEELEDLEHVVVFSALGSSKYSDTTGLERNKVEVRLRRDLHKSKVQFQMRQLAAEPDTEPDDEAIDTTGSETR